jgi:hypothetical protein
MIQESAQLPRMTRRATMKKACIVGLVSAPNCFYT